MCSNRKTFCNSVGGFFKDALSKAKCSSSKSECLRLIEKHKLPDTLNEIGKYFNDSSDHDRTAILNSLDHESQQCDKKIATLRKSIKEKKTSCFCMSSKRLTKEERLGDLIRKAAEINLMAQYLKYFVSQAPSLKT